MNSVNFDKEDMENENEEFCDFNDLPENSQNKPPCSYGNQNGAEFLQNDGFEMLEQIFDKKYNQLVTEFKEQISSCRTENKTLKRMLEKMTVSNPLFLENQKLKIYIKVLFKYIKEQKHENSYKLNSYKSSTSKSALLGDEIERSLETMNRDSSAFDSNDGYKPLRSFINSSALSVYDTYSRKPSVPKISVSTQTVPLHNSVNEYPSMKLDSSFNITIRSNKHRCTNMKCSCHADFVFPQKSFSDEIRLARNSNKSFAESLDSRDMASKVINGSILKTATDNSMPCNELFASNESTRTKCIRKNRSNKIDAISVSQASSFEATNDSPINEKGDRFYLESKTCRCAELRVQNNEFADEIDRIYEQLQNYQNELGNLRKINQEYKTLEEENEMLSEQVNDLQRFCPTWCKSAQELRAVNNTLDEMRQSYETEINKLKEENASINSECAKLSEIIDNENKNKNEENLTLELNWLRKENEGLTLELEQVLQELKTMKDED